jgi:catechol 2,3-dioxygenase-like lactoylglutathione lyase family enzyme
MKAFGRFTCLFLFGDPIINNHKQRRNLASCRPMMSSKITAGISHVGLAVSNLEASLKFFQALGFNKVGGRESYPSYFVSDGTSLITLWQTKENSIPFDRTKNVGLHHLAIKVPSLDALHTAYETAIQIDGVKTDFAPEPLTGTAWMHAMVFEPSGCRIEFTYQP